AAAGGLAITAAFAAACAITVPPPRTPRIEAADAAAAWARVLDRFVDANGRIDFAGLARGRGDLDGCVGYLAQVDPRSHPQAFPSASASLAFDLDAYNALAMYNVLQSGIPREL